MHIHRSSLLLQISLSLFALALTAAIPPADLTPGSGVTLPDADECAANSLRGREGAPVEIFIQDLVYGIPPGATLVTMTSRLGGSETIMTIGGPTTLNVQARKGRRGHDRNLHHECIQHAGFPQLTCPR